jgi:hypothetical protein
MTDAQRTLIAVLLDRSGSMEAVKDDTEGGFNAFIDSQRSEPGSAVVTLAQFDNVYEVVYANKPIAEVPRLALQPRASTALYDSLGRLITDVGAELAALPEHARPGTVIVVVFTDGHENSSTEWTHAAITAAIKRQETVYAWDFLFLGANMDAVAVGTAMGFSADKSLTWHSDNAGAVHAMAATSAYVSRKRAAPAGAQVDGYSEDERRAAGGQQHQ